MSEKRNDPPPTESDDHSVVSLYSLHSISIVILTITDTFCLCQINPYSKRSRTAPVTPEKASDSRKHASPEPTPPEFPLTQMSQPSESSQETTTTAASVRQDPEGSSVQTVADKDPEHTFDFLNFAIPAKPKMINLSRNDMHVSVVLTLAGIELWSLSTSSMGDDFFLDPLRKAMENPAKSAAEQFVAQGLITTFARCDNTGKLPTNKALNNLTPGKNGTSYVRLWFARVLRPNIPSNFGSRKRWFEGFLRNVSILHSPILLPFLPLLTHMYPYLIQRIDRIYTEYDVHNHRQPCLTKERIIFHSDDTPARLLPLDQYVPIGQIISYLTLSLPGGNKTLETQMRREEFALRFFTYPYHDQISAMFPSAYTPDPTRNFTLHGQPLAQDNSSS